MEIELKDLMEELVKVRMEEFEIIDVEVDHEDVEAEDEVEVEDELHEVVFKLNLKKLKNVKLQKINRKLKKLKITLKLCFDQIVIKL